MSFFFRMISISLALIFVENTVFARAIDTSALISVSRNRKNLFGFGICAVYFSVVTGFLGFFADNVLLESQILNEQAYIYQPFIYITILGVVYIITLLILWNYFYKVFLRIKKFIHLSALNCAILGAMFLNAQNCSALSEYIFRGIGVGLGFAFAIYLTAIVYERLHDASVPYCFRGYPLTLLYIGILSMAFYGLASTPIKY
ncbi:MAG: Rnf-Nqr domain containing protein [Oscillospiraceae bacterium]